jgi:hypothetical protein
VLYKDLTLDDKLWNSNTYIKTFDITNFSSENVPTASLCLKAVTKALGDKDLPTNTLQKVLKGFAKSLTDSFNELCANQIALQHGSFYQTLMKTTLSSSNSTML